MRVAFSGVGTGLPQFYDLGAVARRRQLKAQWSKVLDESHRLISSGRTTDGMDGLASYLLALREVEDPAGWDQFCQTVIHHPVGQLVWQDPFTLHSFRSPRGYSGDAQLLDYIYRKSPPPDDTSPLGREVFEYMIRQLGARSVRSRCEILARIIDETAVQARAPRILSVACGHLREAALSGAVTEGRFEEFLALDQDSDSLAQVENEFGEKGVRTVRGSVRAILAGKTQFENFHLVYAAGLYDYLSDRVAARLTRLMFDMLAPGGRLVVANFAPCLPEMGYMETFMSWKLIYRRPLEVHMLAQDIAGDEWKSSRLFWDEHESIVFLDLVKRQPKLELIGKPDARRFTVPGLKNMTVDPNLGTGGRERNDRQNVESSTDGGASEDS